ncbi:MAG: hypothetical protein ACMG6S_21025, partial [Byssovorax sp.]
MALGPGHAGAEVGAIHPGLVKATTAARNAKGAEVYASLREIWRTWDRADPTQVEEALRSMADSPTATAPVKAYARLLTAYARRRRGDLDGSVKTIESLGFIGRWMTLGPFDNENKAGFAREFPPEAELLGPIELGRSYDGKERQVRWRTSPEVSAHGWFDFGELMRPRENVCAYATTFLRAKAGTKTPRKVSVWIGTSGAFRLYWNGEPALEDAGYRDLDADRFATLVTLGPGTNRVTMKVCGDEESPKFALRLGDEKGAPDLGVDVVADPSASTTADGDASANPRPAAKAKPAAKAVAVAATAKKAAIEGPMQELERRTSDPRATPSEIEAFA